MSDPAFEIDDKLSFSDNLSEFAKVLADLDPELGPALLKEITQADEAESFDRELILERLHATLKDPSK